MGPLTKELMLQSLHALNTEIKKTHPEKKVILIMGGGGAMILAHGFPRGTTDIDAIPREMNPEVLAPMVRVISEKLDLPIDWLNPYFSTFSHTLNPDYGKRLITVFDDTHLKVEALGKEEMLTMKCFAHRTKDIPHARSLINGKADVLFVESRIRELIKKKIPGSEDALRFLEDLLDEEAGE